MKDFLTSIAGLRAGINGGRMGGIALALLCVFALTLCFTACPSGDDDTPTCTVTFNSNDGTAVEAQTVPEGGTATAPAAPAKALTLTAAGFYTNYTFAGWYKEAALTNEWDFGTDTVTADITLYAKWTGGAIDTTTRTGTTVIDKAVAWLTANAAANTTYTLVLDADISQAPVTLSGLAADNITLVVTTMDDTEREVTLSANGSLFTVGEAGGSAVTLRLDRRVTLKGISGNDSPLVFVNANGTLEAEGNAKITGNNAPWSWGGGVTVSGGTFTLSGSASVSGNSASYNGGGVWVNGGTFTMSGGSVSNNTAADGGGVYVYNGGTFTMSGGSVSNNSAGGGGGIKNNGTFLMSGGSVSGNTAGNCGGGVLVKNTGTFTMNGGSISGNTAHNGGTIGTGGGIQMEQNAVTIINGGTISGNRALGAGDDGGGGIMLYGGTLTINGGEIRGNTSAKYGGGVSVNSSGTFTMNGGRIQGGADSGGFTKNTASIGAALYNGGTAKFGAASTNCAVGSTSMSAGDNIGTTSETITATGTGL